MQIKNLRKSIVILFVFLILIFSFSYVCAEDYYADIQITVDDTGVVDIDGISNHPDLLVENSNRYTYKKQSYWLINITKEEIFSDYIYVLTLPKGAKRIKKCRRCDNLTENFTCDTCKDERKKENNEKYEKTENRKKYKREYHQTDKYKKMRKISYQRRKLLKSKQGEK